MLTAKQEKFAQEWFATGNKTEAYRRAYPASLKWTENSLNARASELSRHGKVLARFSELAKAAQERNDTTVDLADKMLKKAYTVADKDVKPSAMVSAVIALIKLHGLDVETKHRIAATREGDMSPAEYLRKLADMLPD